MTRSGIGAVVIGRNEGERLRECLESVLPQVARTVYVDSGSSDGSIELAIRLGAEVVELSSANAFTAARARNAGWKRLAEMAGDTQFVQFVDGDCVLHESWITNAVREFAAHQEVAIVSGHVREKLPRRNIYHRLAAIEWDTPVGVAQYCGGVALVRASALAQVGGFNDTLVAGEEPELCVRLRQAGWSILKLDYEMAVHDMDIGSLGQWWRRMVRAGYAYAEGAALHGSSPQRHWVRESRSNWIWGAVLPILAAAFAWPTGGLSILAALALYLTLFAKILANRVRQGGEGASTSALYAAMCVVAKWPQAVGQVVYWIRRLCSGRFKIVESAPSSTSVRNV